MKPLPGDYVGHSADTSEEQARAAFVKRYGRDPRRVVRTAGCVLAGPKPVRHPEPVQLTDGDWIKQARLGL